MQVTNSHCYNTVFYCEVEPELLANQLTFDRQHDDYKWFSTVRPVCVVVVVVVVVCVCRAACCCCCCCCCRGAACW